MILINLYKMHLLIMKARFNSYFFNLSLVLVSIFLFFYFKHVKTFVFVCLFFLIIFFNFLVHTHKYCVFNLFFPFIECFCYIICFFMDIFYTELAISVSEVNYGF